MVMACPWDHRVVYRGVVSSTMTEARALVLMPTSDTGTAPRLSGALHGSQGVQEGTTVVAESQQHGRGRRGRTWVSSPGAGLWMTTILRPTVSSEMLSSLGIVVGVAVHRAVSMLGATSAQLKWPNDVVIAGRKLAGILLESEQLPDGSAVVFVGIGINIAMREQALGSGTGYASNSGEDDVWHRYIGLHDVTDSRPDPHTVLHTVLRTLHTCYDQWCGAGLAPLLESWHHADALRGCTVRAQLGTEIVEGTAEGVDQRGGLLLRTAQGSQIRIVAGEVEQVRAVGNVAM